MIPQRFAEAKSVMRAPSGMPNCVDVHAFAGHNTENQPLVITAWRPTPEELVKINLGEPVYLVIFMNGMPPVVVTADTPFAEAEAIAKEPA